MDILIDGARLLYAVVNLTIHQTALPLYTLVNCIVKGHMIVVWRAMEPVDAANEMEKLWSWHW